MLLSKYKVKSYTFEEFKEVLESESYSLESIIMSPLCRKVLIILLALFMHYTGATTVILADSFNVVGFQSSMAKIFEMLMNLARFGCMGMGIFKTVESLLNGASFKEASIEGVQFWLGYLFLKFYPVLFEI